MSLIMGERVLLDSQELQQRLAELVLLTAEHLPRAQFQRVMDVYEQLLVWIEERPHTTL